MRKFGIINDDYRVIVNSIINIEPLEELNRIPHLRDPMRAIQLNNLQSSIPVILLLVIATLAISSCATKKESITANQATIDLALIQSLPTETISYEDKVKPVLQNRCVVCHGCYDAPCQLKLSSPAGMQRGGSKELVYNGARFKTMDPTRLGIDAKTTQQWRQKNFHAVLNETDDDPAANLSQSVLYRMLRMKQISPQPRVGMIPDRFDLSLGRKQTCPTLEEFDNYQEKFPQQGMPFAMPNLDHEEYRVLVQWLAQGAPVPADKKPSSAASIKIKKWESFLNGPDLKQQLVSRYLYEHLFLGQLHIQGTDEREFYRLVRSTTPSGQKIDEIATVRPYDDPGGKVYYRLQRYQADIVAKSHVLYELSDQRLQRIRELFIKPDYQVTQLPSWDPDVAANPFKAYAEIPPLSRYKFLLDDARFFIEGFMKGPVCRGMIALNVIEDRFWVVFLDPEKDNMLKKPELLLEMSDYLKIPSSQAGNIRLLGAWKKYLKLEQEYVARRFEFFEAMNQYDIKDAMNFIWDGDGKNANAALTVLRHFDSASVDYGFVGDYPETAWVLDYPTFERIHYLLVAGFNVFGNLKHQLNTRLYMDFLRMEGEDMYLAFLPTTHRRQIRDSWYSGMRQGMERDLGEVDNWMNKDVVTGYTTDDPQRELFQHMEKKLAPVLARDDVINRCGKPSCKNSPKNKGNDKKRADMAMQKIAAINGITLAAFPDLAFVRVMKEGKPGEDLAYTIIRNKAYKNVTSMFSDEKDSETRDYSNDSLTVVDWLEGSYPNFFFQVDINDIEKFTEHYASLQNREDYERFVSVYGIRRTNQDYWKTADWFQARSRQERPLRSGIYDLNRYENR